ncbi:MAG: tetratricopeptide repeat protein, partial [Bacteroidia bacterium]|nr:tetratricopeptide repeat protein [Bacteroidia bacterium]
MIKIFYGTRLLLCLSILTGFIFSSASPAVVITFLPAQEQDPVEFTYQKDNGIIEEEIRQLNIYLQPLLTNGSLDRSRIVVDSIIQKIDNNNISDSSTLSESYYFIGVYYLLAKNYYESIKFFNISVALKESRKEYGERFAKALNNIGVAYKGLGDFNKLEYYSLKSLVIRKKINDE